MVCSSKVWESVRVVRAIYFIHSHITLGQPESIKV